MESLVTLAAMDAASMAWRLALAFFLFLAAVGSVYMLVRAGNTLRSVEKMVEDLDREMVPLLQKVGTTVEEVNQELDKVNELTATAVSMAQKVDATARAVESAVGTPAKKAAAFTAGVQQTLSSLVHRFRSGAMRADHDAWTEWPPADTTVRGEESVGSGPTPAASAAAGTDAGQAAAAESVAGDREAQ